MYCHEFKYSFEFFSFPLLLPIDRWLFSSAGCRLQLLQASLSKNSTVSPCYSKLILVLMFDVLEAKSPKMYCHEFKYSFEFFTFPLLLPIDRALFSSAATAASYLKIAQFLPLGRAWLQKQQASLCNKGFFPPFFFLGMFLYYIRYGIFFLKLI